MTTTTNNTIELTPEQLVNLLKNVYCLHDENGEIFSTDENSFDLENEQVELYSIKGDSFAISTKGASVNGCILSVANPYDTEVESFTLLSTVNSNDLID
jgi:hypothetical protein